MAQTKRLFLLLLAVSMTGCTSLFSPQVGMFGPTGDGTRTGSSSSLVDYLYPEGQKPPAPSDAVPHLNLPLKVGIAFVPTAHGTIRPSEAVRVQTLERVREEFVSRDYVDHIEVIPDTYMRSTRGVTGMQQLARLYGVDVIALVSWDQLSVTSDTNAAFLYWTIVGAYTIEGTKNSVQTFVDTAVFDVASGQLLFRAPGVDERNDRSTAIGSYEVARVQNEDSFTAAMEVMTGNLADSLAEFEQRIAERPESVQVSYREGYSGGGSLDGLFLLFLVGLAVAGIGWRGRPTRETD